MATGIHEITSDKDGGTLLPSNYRGSTVSLPTHQEVHESTGDKNDGKLLPSNHGHRDGTVSPPTHQDDDTIKDRRLCSTSQKDDKDVIKLNSLENGLSNIPQQQCEEQNKPSDAVFKTVTLKAQDKQGISEKLDKMTSSQNKSDSICIYLGSPEILIGKDNMYQEGRDFTIEKACNKGSNADVWTNDIEGAYKKPYNAVVFLAGDKKTQRLHVLKHMRRSKFRKAEIEVPLDLQKAIRVPELYAVCLKDNFVRIHMELIENAIPLEKVIKLIPLLDPLHIWPFSRFILLEILAIVNAMHEQNITHGDLHGSNILLQIQSDNTIRFVLIDFGESNNLETNPKEYQIDKGGLVDIGEALMKACSSVEAIEQQSEQAELRKIIDMMQNNEPTTDVQQILQRQSNQKDKGMMLQAVIPILSQDPAFLEASRTQTPSNRETPVAPLSRSTEKWGDETKMTGQKESQAAKDSLGINTNATSDQEENHGTPQPAVEAQSPQVNGTLQSPLNVIFPRASGTKVERAEREGSQNWL
ncbi:uncharacterized protein LOC117315014 isoform X2 [Pecten maximus]|uniref:uncharacterized protein LOC117315014 isoform X2 n=1 Tax=Pecten maximus TaxID=6579 RepID=UPI001457E5C9|nr:uncharacterized protein LOC117315014 isoform X2 [Pecten maximus]